MIIVNDVVFTEREYDVLSCLLFVRASKTIALILSISHRTVENYIAKILLKIKSNTKDSIVNFLQKSNQQCQIKEHYSNLFLKYYFKQFFSNNHIDKKYLDVALIDLTHAVNKYNNKFIEYYKLIFKNLTILNRENIVIPKKCDKIIVIADHKSDIHPINKIKKMLSHSKIIILNFSSIETIKNNEGIDILSLKKIQDHNLMLLLTLEKIITNFEFSTLIKEYKNIKNNIYKLQNDEIKEIAHKNITLEEDQISLSILVNKYKYLFIFIFIVLTAILSITIFQLPKYKQYSYIKNKSSSVVNYVTRKEVFELGDALSSYNNVLISGVSGVGKTTFVRNYVENIKFKNTYWLNNAAEVNKTYFRIALDMGVVYSNNHNYLNEVVNNYVEKNSIPILFVIDNILSSNELDKIHKTIPKGAKLIVISENPKIMINSNHYHIRLLPFSEGEINLYIKIYNDVYEKYKIQEIVNKLGNLPKNLSSYTAYNRMNTLLDIDDFLNDKNENSFWNNSIRKLIHSEYGELMMFFEILDRKYIPIDLLTKSTKKSKYELQKILNTLEQMSFLSYKYQSNNIGVSIDEEIFKNICIYLREQPPSLKEKVEADVVNLIDGEMPYVSNNPDHTWMLAEKIISNVKAVIKNSRDKKNPKIISLYEKVAQYTNKIENNIEYAIEITSKVLELKNNIKHFNSFDVALTMSNLADLYQLSFVEPKNETALKYKFDALRLLRGYNGKDEEIAQILIDIATLYYRRDIKEDIEKGIEYLNQGLEIRKSLFGNIHHSVAEAFDLIGGAYIRLGDEKNFKLGLKYKFKSYEMRKKLYGDNHLDIFLSLNNIGWSYNRASDGDKKLAIEYLKKAYDIVNNLYSADHFHKATVMYNIAVYFVKQELYNSAIPYLEKSLEIRKKFYPANSIRLIKTSECLEGARKKQDTCHLF